MKIQDKNIEIDIQENRVFLFIDGFNADGFIDTKDTINDYYFGVNEVDEEIEEFFYDNYEEIEEMIFNIYLS